MSMTSLIGGIVAAFVATVTEATGAISVGDRSIHMEGRAMNGGVSDLLHDLEKVAGRDPCAVPERRMERLADASRPMLDGLPTNSAGRLGFDVRTAAWLVREWLRDSR